MPTSRLYYTLYNCIVESYKDVETLQLSLCERLNAPRPQRGSIHTATAELINYCKYQGELDNLIETVVARGPDRNRSEALEVTLRAIDQIAVSISPDMHHVFEKIPSSFQSYKNKVKFLRDIPSRWGMDSYYLELANTLDQCSTHIVVLGQSLGRAQKDKPFAGKIQPYCAFFWDLPTYFLLPRGREQYWRSRIHTMSNPEEQKWPPGEIREYVDPVDLFSRFQNLISELEIKVSEASKFDVFLCHNVIDKPEVKEIGEQLKEHGILPWLDEWELRPGLPWQPLLEEQIGQIKSAAVFIGRKGIGPWQQQEIDAFLREFVNRGCPVIPVLLPDAPKRPRLPVFLRGMTWVDFRKSDPDPLERLIWGITGKKSKG